MRYYHNQSRTNLSSSLPISSSPSCPCIRRRSIELCQLSSSQSADRSSLWSSDTEIWHKRWCIQQIPITWSWRMQLLPYQGTVYRSKLQWNSVSVKYVNNFKVCGFVSTHKNEAFNMFKVIVFSDYFCAFSFSRWPVHSLVVFNN